MVAYSLMLHFQNDPVISLSFSSFPSPGTYMVELDDSIGETNPKKTRP